MIYRFQPIYFLNHDVQWEYLYLLPHSKGFYWYQDLNGYAIVHDIVYQFFLVVDLLLKTTSLDQFYQLILIPYHPPILSNKNNWLLKNTMNITSWVQGPLVRLGFKTLVHLWRHCTSVLPCKNLAIDFQFLPFCVATAFRKISSLTIEYTYHRVYVGFTVTSSGHHFAFSAFFFIIATDESRFLGSPISSSSFLF